MTYRVRLTRKPTRFLRSAAQVEIILKQYEFEFEHRLMRIISRRTLRDFYWQDAARYNDARAALEAWYHEVKKASWQNPSDIKAQYRSASILKGGRVGEHPSFVRWAGAARPPNETKPMNVQK